MSDLCIAVFLKIRSRMIKRVMCACDPEKGKRKLKWQSGPRSRRVHTGVERGLLFTRHSKQDRVLAAFVSFYLSPYLLSLSKRWCSRPSPFLSLWIYLETVHVESDPAAHLSLTVQNSTEWARAGAAIRTHGLAIVSFQQWLLVRQVECINAAL